MRFCAYVHCAQDLGSRNARAVYCSRECKERSKQQRDHAAAPKNPQIAKCGTHSGYVCHRKRGEEACSDCRAASVRYYSTPERGEMRAAASQRRRVRILAGEAELIIRLDIFERDGWICGLCGESVNSELKHPNPLSPSLDHIVPVSLGGAHVADNVQLAHLSCNMRKGNRVELPAS